MMSPKLIFVILIFHYIRQSEQVDCQYSGNCDTASSSVITCEKGGACKCEEGGAFCTALEGSLSPAPEFKDVDVAKCTEWCTLAKLQGAPEEDCKYWKFVHENFNIITCYLMDSTGCAQFAPNTECDNSPFSDHDQRPRCKSFHLEGEPACDPDTGTTTTTISPQPQSCPGPIEKGDSSDTTKFYQGWKCFQPNDNTMDIKDMYVDSEMPVGGFCKLDDSDGGSCKAEYKYICDESGTWAKANSQMGEDGLTNDKKIKDLECAATPLTNVLLEEEGRDISCINGGLTADTVADDGTGTIPSENVCLMLCDGYAALSFYTDWNKGAEGRGWFYEFSGTQSEPVSMSDGADINCWGNR